MLMLSIWTVAEGVVRVTLKVETTAKSKRVENTVGKGEIARYEQFLLLLQVFQRDLFYRHVKIKTCLGKI